MAAAAAIEGHFVDIRSWHERAAQAPRLARGRSSSRAILDRRQILLPLIDVQEDADRTSARPPRAADRRGSSTSAAATGRWRELRPAWRPGAQAVLVDFSEPMLARVRRAPGPLARRALGGLPRRPRRPGAGRRSCPAAATTPSFRAMAIHHLPAERKRALYAEAFELLAPGGMFVNMDYVSDRRAAARALRRGDARQSRSATRRTSTAPSRAGRRRDRRGPRQ